MKEKKQRISEKLLIDIAVDLIFTKDFEKDIAKRHGIRHDQMVVLKSKPRFKHIYNKVADAALEAEVRRRIQQQGKP